MIKNTPDSLEHTLNHIFTSYGLETCCVHCVEELPTQWHIFSSLRRNIFLSLVLEIEALIVPIVGSERTYIDDVIATQKENEIL